MKKNIYIALTSLLFMSRIFLYISTQDVGVEHDSGWYLGVARNVVERGIYASYTNTVSTTEKSGGFPSIHKRFSVQDKNGFVYFPAGVTAGPGYVLPEAFFLKLFGYGWAQYRLWPFIALCLLIPLLFFIVLNISSFLGLLFFQACLWFYPQLLLVQSYEALSEHIALLFLLLGYLFLEKMFLSKKTKYFFLSGIFLGLSIQTKLIFSLGAIVPMLSVLYFYKTNGGKKNISHMLWFIGALILPTVLFELYRFSYLSLNFGFPAYWANIIDQKRTLVTVGSGLTMFRDGIRLQFLFDKLALWKHIGIDPYFAAWPLILSAPFLHRKRGAFFWNVWLSGMLFFLWYGFASTTGWFRHIIPGVILCLILISGSLSLLVQRFTTLKKPLLLFLFCLFLFPLCFNFATDQRAIPNVTLTKKRVLSLFWEIPPNKIQGPVSHAVFPKSDQDGVVKAITSRVPPQTRICYSGLLLVAEIPPLVDRVFFPMGRCKENDILIIGPYQKGPFALLNKKQLAETMDGYCKRNIFTNTSYSLCQIKNPSIFPKHVIDSYYK